MPAPHWLARFNRRATNRVSRHIAPYVPGFGVVTHVGRKTQQRYYTPVNVFQHAPHYVIALTYGRDSQWVRNVLAAGGCELTTRGRTWQLTQPRLRHDARRRAVPPPVRVVLRLLNVADFLVLTRVGYPAQRCAISSIAVHDATAGDARRMTQPSPPALKRHPSEGSQPMPDQARRKALREQYAPQAGVYRFVNTRNNKILLGSALNLTSMRSKLEFALATHTVSALDRRLHADARQYGLDAFTFEIVEVIDVTPDMTPAQIREDLAILEALYREQLDPAVLYG